MPDKTEIQATVELQGAENPDPEAPQLPWWKRTRNRILMIVGAVGAAIALAVAAVSVLPTQLTKMQVIEDYDAAALTSKELTQSVYASNVGYEIDSREVSSIEDNGFNAKVAHLTINLRNKNFLVQVLVDQNYELSGRHWVPKRAQITDVVATPITPVDEARVLADIDTLMNKVPNHGRTSFATLYNGGEFEVASSELSEDGKSCTLFINARKLSGLYQYAGELEARFNFIPGETSSNPGSWKLSRVSANDDCWERSLAPLVGAWQGRLDGTETSAVIFDTGLCHGGKESPIQLDVKSFDVESGKLVADLEFTSHVHPALPENKDASEGDTKVSLEQVEIALDPESLSGTYSSADQDSSQGRWEIEFFNDAGSWRVRVKSSGGNDPGLIWGATAFTDTYTLNRA